MPPTHDPFDTLISRLLDEVLLPAAERLADRLTRPPRPPRPSRPRLRPAATPHPSARSNRAQSRSTGRPPAHPLPGKKGFDPYETLEVSRNASPETIRAAYLSLCKKWHPDVNKTEKAKRMMVKVNAAWEMVGPGRGNR